MPEEPDGETVPVSVLKVFDGDGFLARVDLPGVDVELAVRMGFIDAPEMDQPGGKEARDFLRRIVDRQRLELIILMKMDTGMSFDRHGRVVAVPYLRTGVSSTASVPTTARKRCRNVELEMVINGWAWVLERYGPNQAYLDALDDAQRHRRGIWAWDNNVHPGRAKAARYKSKSASKKIVTHSGGLFAEQPSGTPCESSGCTGHMVERQGKFGRFYGCSRFPECRYARSDRGV